MLGTYSPVTELDWAVVVQKPRLEAYRGVFEMQHTARLLALLSVLCSIMVSFYAARRIANPLRVLTESSRAIARGDFSKRVELRSRTEIGELASTFNMMSDELEQFVQDLSALPKRIARSLSARSRCWPARSTKRIPILAATPIVLPVIRFLSRREMELDDDFSKPCASLRSYTM